MRCQKLYESGRPVRVSVSLVLHNHRYQRSVEGEYPCVKVLIKEILNVDVGNTDMYASYGEGGRTSPKKSRFFYDKNAITGKGAGETVRPWL